MPGVGQRDEGPMSGKLFGFVMQSDLAQTVLILGSCLVNLATFKVLFMICDSTSTEQYSFKNNTHEKYCKHDLII